MKRRDLTNDSVPNSWRTGPPDPPADADLAPDERGHHRWVCSGPLDDQPWCGDCGVPLEVHEERPTDCPGARSGR